MPRGTRPDTTGESRAWAWLRLVLDLNAAKEHLTGDDQCLLGGTCTGHGRVSSASRRVRVAAEQRMVTRFDIPMIGNADLDSAKNDIDLQHTFLAVDLRA